jgi:hypothetical protein
MFVIQFAYLGFSCFGRVSFFSLPLRLRTLLLLRSTIARLADSFNSGDLCPMCHILHFRHLYEVIVKSARLGPAIAKMHLPLFGHQRTAFCIS